MYGIFVYLAQPFVPSISYEVQKSDISPRDMYDTLIEREKVPKEKDTQKFSVHYAFRDRKSSIKKVNLRAGILPVEKKAVP